MSAFLAIFASWSWSGLPISPLAILSSKSLICLSFFLRALSLFSLSLEAPACFWPAGVSLTLLAVTVSFWVGKKTGELYFGSSRSNLVAKNQLSEVCICKKKELTLSCSFVLVSGLLLDLLLRVTSSTPVVTSSISNATSLAFFSFFFCFFRMFFFCARDIGFSVGSGSGERDSLIANKLKSSVKEYD